MPIDVPALRARAKAVAARLDDPRACAAEIRKLFRDLADHSRRLNQRPVGGRLDEQLRTPAPVIHEMGVALRVPVQRNPAAAAELANALWAAGSREERRLASDILGILASGSPDEVLQQLEALLPRCDGAEIVDALVLGAFKPLLLREPGQALVVARRWTLQRNKWLRRAAALSVYTLAQDARWDDLPGMFEILRKLATDSDPTVRPAVVDALRAMTAARPLDVRPFLHEQAVRNDHNSRFLVRTVMKLLPTDWQSDLVRDLRS
ncbi:MAG TPA: DNA alkylation repair protein [Anaerolineales bacterium]|nr:DNA alkylation repair protein [Anaerolineales bacterium]HRF47914.1 DNA alkylation repair protein [Anaerolineales bacterium]